MTGGRLFRGRDMDSVAEKWLRERVVPVLFGLRFSTLALAVSVMVYWTVSRDYVMLFAAGPEKVAILLSGLWYFGFVFGSAAEARRRVGGEEE